MTARSSRAASDSDRIALVALIAHPPLTCIFPDSNVRFADELPEAETYCRVFLRRGDAVSIPCSGLQELLRRFKARKTGRLIGIKRFGNFTKEFEHLRGCHNNHGGGER